jgi:hypothetical protein
VLRLSPQGPPGGGPAPPAPVAGSVSGGPGPDDRSRLSPQGTPPSAPTGSAPDRATATSVPRCALDRLRVTAAAGDAGMMHRSVVLTFANTGGGACQLHGYPGVAALDATGAQVAQARREPTGYLGGTGPSSGPSTGAGSGAALPTVTVTAGASASALVEAAAVGDDGNACTRYAAILVTPPGETRSAQLPWPGDGCHDLTVHPVVPGTTGTG